MIYSQECEKAVFKANKVILLILISISVLCSVACNDFSREDIPTEGPIITLTPEPDNPTEPPVTTAPAKTTEEVVADYFSKRELCISLYLPFFGDTQINSDDALVFILSYYDFYKNYTEYKYEINDDLFYYEIPAEIISDLFNKTFYNPPSVFDCSYYDSNNGIIRYEYTGNSIDGAAGIIRVLSVKKLTDDMFDILLGEEMHTATLHIKQTENGYQLISFLAV